MRSLRKAAIAGATAVALTLGSTGIAAAAETDTNTASNASVLGGISSTIGNHTKALENASGEAIFGSSKEDFTGADKGQTLGEQPAWAKILYSLTWLGAIGSFVGLVVGPIYNSIVHGPHA